MHGSHKLWITIAIFMVVVAFLLAMYFTATPDKVGSVIAQKKGERSMQIKKRDNSLMRETTVVEKENSYTQENSVNENIETREENEKSVANN